MLALDEAVKVLARIDPRKGQVVELRFFGGLSVEEKPMLGGMGVVSARHWKRTARSVTNPPPRCWWI